MSKRQKAAQKAQLSRRKGEDKEEEEWLMGTHGEDHQPTSHSHLSFRSFLLMEKNALPTRYFNDMAQKIFKKKKLTTLMFSYIQVEEDLMGLFFCKLKQTDKHFPDLWH